jgi:putative SOS response-associated peptidase YedK
MHYAPLVMQDGDRRVMRLGRYHCRKAGERSTVDRELPGLYNARRDSLGKYWQGLFGVSHAVMMVESFFENVEREGKNQVLHFVPKPAGTMLIACLAATWQDPKGGRPLLSFAAITDELPAEVAAAGQIGCASTSSPMVGWSWRGRGWLTKSCRRSSVIGRRRTTSMR